MKIHLRSPQILFENLTVHAIENNGGVFIGRNHQFYWETTITSSNCGFGVINGKNNQTSYNAHLVLLDDQTDSAKKPIIKGENASHSD
ncbi:hypothetical protein [Priestia abyssalis]|uniref:hypothetical protein n=1 Tax=Priestia abyssalis TaxID=1221450 RepID=UPI000994BE38|nr:hypothetical protein [Priestia abyssalis]